MMMKNKIVHGFDHTADWIAKVRNVSRLGSCSFTRRPVHQSPLASRDVLPTGPPNKAVYSLTGNASSPFHAEPAQEEDVATVKEIPANLPKHLPGRKYDRRFFFAITLLLVVVVAIGFGPTYYLAGVFRAPLPSRIVHIHGAVFSTWMILLVVQTGLISTGRVEWHRKLGVAGFVLACGMVLTVLLTAADFAMRAKAKPNSEALLTLLVVPFTDAAAFAVLAGLAYALRKNAAAHKRLIIIATAGPVSYTHLT